MQYINILHITELYFCSIQHLQKVVVPLFSLPKDLYYPLCLMARVAQLVRASGCGPEGRGFDPHLSPQY